MRGSVCVAIFFVVTCTAFAQVVYNAQPQGSLLWQRPVLEFPDTLPAATVLKEMITKLRVGKVQVVLEETELKEVQKRLGGKIVRSGDASTANASLCFCGKDVNGQWALWLDSSEIAGLRLIDGFTLERLNGNAGADRRCRLIPEDEGGVELPIALQFGQTEMQVRQILGKPTLRYRSSLIFEHEHQETIRNEPYTVINTVTIGLRHGRVWVLQVFKSTQS